MTSDEKRALFLLATDIEDLFEDGFRRPERRVPQFCDDQPSSGVIAADAPGPRPAMEDQDCSAEVESAESALKGLEREVRGCTRCMLSETRNQAVPGEGAIRPVVFLIGEGPGAEEDRSGRPFVGAAGRYLDKWLEAIGLDRGSDCYIGNIVKCRPPGNRDPAPDEAAACMPFLEQQVDLLAPRVILTLGRVAIQNLLGTTRGIGEFRGRIHQYRGVPVVPTYHPSGVLRNPSYRQPVWEDLQRLKTLIESADA